MTLKPEGVAMAEQLKPVEVSPGTDVSLLGENHIRVYRETNGERGYLWNGVPILLLTSTGRKSGQPRTIPIIFTAYKNSFIIIASKGGSPTHPKWYLNVAENPHVTVQVKAEIFEAVARTAQQPEREELWAQAVKTWPNFDVYQSRTTRQIPVVVIERI
jgi:deazaflavin-dependent oxidoreductase (nitroreductase family)